MKPILTLQNPNMEEHTFAGLVEHSHTLLGCSACGKELIDIMVVEPDAPLVTKIRAKCPFCGDRSLPSVIRGGFCVGSTDHVVYTGDEYLQIDEEGIDLNVVLKTVEVK